MLSFYSEFVAQHRPGWLLLVLSFCLAVGATFVFGYRAGRSAQHVHWKNEPIQPWMSVPFVAHTHHVRPRALFLAIRVPPNPRDQRPLRDIARTQKVPVADLIRDLRNAIANAGPTDSESVPPSRKAP